MRMGFIPREQGVRSCRGKAPRRSAKRRKAVPYGARKRAISRRTADAPRAVWACVCSGDPRFTILRLPCRARIRRFWLLHETPVDEIVAQHCAVEVEQVIKLVGDHPAFADPGRLKNKLSLIVPRIVLLIVPKTSAAVWVLILLFGTPTGTTLLTTVTTFVATLVLA